MIKFFLAGVLLWAGVGCVSQPPKVYQGDFYSLKDGQGEGMVVKDFWPLDPAREDDLVEVGLSLPVWESKQEHSRDWVREYSPSGKGVDRWTSAADGAQSPVVVERLVSASNGAARYRVYVNTGLVGPPMRHDLRVERVDGGWLILETRKTSRR